MASSSSLRRTWRYNVFTSFHGPDVRETLLSHLRKQFENNGITMFNDEEIRRGEVIAPALTQAIEESRISIVLLSKQYASSSWCLDELLEIIKCRKEIGQEVMTVFYGVEPSDVRKQDGEFGDAFNKTCAEKTEEKREKWRKALTEVGNIAGEDFKKWKNEAKMIEKIASNISDILHNTAPKYFDGMVGLEAHMREMESRLEFDNNDVGKIVAISGPAGIGKTTIARAIYSRHSKIFHHDCFLDLRKLSNCDEDALREQLLSQVLNLNGIKKCHSGLIPERLHDQRVFIILDDVQSINQLDVLADIRWYGPGSRIIVTTENEEILQQHGINDIYHVSFPSQEEALKIFCLSAFRKTSPPDGFLNLSNEIVKICSNLPLGLKLVGSSLRGKNLDDWELQLPRLKDSLDGRIESVLQLGYKSLHEKDQLIFLCIAVFFNGEDVDYVTSKLDEPNWNARLGLKNLVNRNLIQYVDGRVEMHHLLQLLARQVISNQDSKWQILVNPHEIHNVLEKATGNKSVVGISFDTRKVEKLIISTKAFDKMFNLLFLKIYDDTCDSPYSTAFERNRDLYTSGDDYNEYIRKRVLHIRKRVLHIPEEMEFPSRLRLVHWEAYPRKSLPLRFCVKNLVELNMKDSKLKKLWQGTQPLANLRKMILSCSYHLKELPDLSNATNLEVLDLSFCRALVEIPSSIANLHTLRKLEIDYCESLEIIPSLANLTSLKTVININGCSKLRSFPDFSTNLNFLTSIQYLSMKNTGLKEFPASLRHYSRLFVVQMCSSEKLRTFSTYLPTSVIRLDLTNSGIESITNCIKGLHNLLCLTVSGCKRLVSLPEPPSSLHLLEADNCESLSRVSVPLNTPNASLRFTNCFKLDPQARQAIIKQSYFPVIGSAHRPCGILPGREVPEEFVHKSTRNSLTIPPSSFNRVKGCIVISPKLLQDICTLTRCGRFDTIFFDCKINGKLVRPIWYPQSYAIQAEHLIIFCSHFLPFDPSKVSTTIVLECRVSLGFYPNNKFKAYPLDIIEWGIQTFTDEKEDDEDDEDDDDDDEDDEEEVYKDDVYLQDMAIQETGQCSSALECSSLTGTTEGGDYKFVSRKARWKTMITIIQRLFSKKKKTLK